MGGEGGANLLELAGAGRSTADRVPQSLGQLAQLLLPVRELALALLHRRDVVPRPGAAPGGRLLALGELTPQLLEVALVGREQLALLVELLLALVKRDLERRSRGPDVVPILLDPAAQRLGVARKRGDLLLAR